MSSITPPIPSPVRAVLELFEEALAEVRFGDVDREVLAERRRRLEEAHDRLLQRQAELDDARAELDACRQALTSLARRAHRYAAVFAEDDPALRERVEGIEFEPKPRKRKPRRSRRTADEPATQLALDKGAADARPDEGASDAA